MCESEELYFKHLQVPASVGNSDNLCCVGLPPPARLSPPSTDRLVKPSSRADPKVSCPVSVVVAFLQEDHSSTAMEIVEAKDLRQLTDLNEIESLCRGIVNHPQHAKQVLTVPRSAGFVVQMTGALFDTYAPKADCPTQTSVLSAQCTYWCAVPNLRRNSVG